MTVTTEFKHPGRFVLRRLRAMGRHIFRWRPGRRTALGLLVALPIVGAAIGGATHTSSDFHHKAQAVIVTNAKARGIAAQKRQLERARVLTEAIELPQVVSAARATAVPDRSIEDVEDHVSVAVPPGSAMVRVDVKESSEERAVALANALGIQGLNFIRRLSAAGSGGRTVVGDFEEGRGEWGVVQSLFNTPPLIIGVDTSVARFGEAALGSQCPATPACGPIMRVYNHFEKGVTYTAEGYARSTVGANISMLLGSTAEDVATGGQRRLRPAWRRLAVSWTPTVDRGSVEVGFQTATARATSFSIDGVTLFDPLATSTRRPLRERPSTVRRAFAQAEFAAFSGARPTGEADESTRTVAWALGGALAGLAAALAAIAFGRAAHRRQQP